MYNKKQKNIRYNSTIMKQNALILAELTKAFSEVDHDVVNILLHALQNELMIEESHINLFNYEKIFTRTIKIRASTFKELGKFGVNANQNIFESLKKIRDTSAAIKNFIDLDGAKVRAMTVSLIDSVKWMNKEENSKTLDNREHIFEIQISEWMLKISTREFNKLVGNYTPILLNDVTSIKSSFAKKLYEILKSKQFRETSFSLSLEEMQKIFNLEKRALSYFINNIERNKSKIDIFVQFEYEVFKKDKLISFKFTKK